VLRLAAGLAIWSSSGAPALFAGEPGDRVRELRVCADPNNFPFSNDRMEGFENKIAEIIAKDLHAPVEYTWLSQHGGFIAKTLTADKCDLIMTVAGDSARILTTKPYYSSSYVFVYPKSKHLELHSFDDPVLRTVRIGIQAFGEDGASPAAIALGSRGIVDKIVGFSILNSAENPPGSIIDAVAAGEIDVAVVWGPFGGYFARRQPVELEVIPVAPGHEPKPLPFAFEMSMGVRRGDTAFKAELDGVLDRRRDDIRKVLEDYGVPLVAVPQAALRPQALPGR